MRQLIAGNWKMNGLASSLVEIETVRRALESSRAKAEVLLCVPATLITRTVEAAGGFVPIGGEDCAIEDSGAYTGDVSAEMIKDAGASAVIVGHSERRHGHGETSAVVCRKAGAAHRAGLLAIICVGETEEERKAGSARLVCTRQLHESVPGNAKAGNTALAYEPVWAIGSGRTPSFDEIAEMHAHVRDTLVLHLGPAAREIRILYGGSVNPSNAKGILALSNVDGALIGAASLKASDYLSIVASAVRR